MAELKIDTRLATSVKNPSIYSKPLGALLPRTRRTARNLRRISDKRMLNMVVKPKELS